MPKAKTMLDELARVLKARENALNRLNRRTSNLAHGTPWKNEDHIGRTADSFIDAVDARDESKSLVSNLGDRAVMEFNKIMKSRPGKRVQQKAWDMMPPRLVKEHEYFW